MRRLVTVLIGVRVVAAVVLAFGPATDSAADLDGWDSARFQAIADAPGRPWADHVVEYPPGSVVFIEVLTAGNSGVDGVVSTNRRLVMASLFIDLGLAALLFRRAGSNPGLAYLALGTLMIPIGLLRFDLWAAFAATVATIELLDLRRPGTGTTTDRTTKRAVVVAVTLTLGWLVKLFPALLIPVAFAVRSWRAALLSTAASVAAAGVWTAYGGRSAVDQVVSLRNATGWHLESIPGSIVALVSDEQPRLEADAYRIGTLDPSLVLAARIGFVVVLMSLAWWTSRIDGRGRRRAGLLMMLGSLAALLVTAPLLSPQFLLWLSPFAALLVEQRCDWARPEVVLTGSAMALTSGVLAMFGPPGLDHPVAAGLLLARDAALVGVTVSCTRSLRRLAAGPMGSTRSPSTS